MSLTRLRLLMRCPASFWLAGRTSARRRRPSGHRRARPTSVIWRSFPPSPSCLGWVSPAPSSRASVHSATQSTCFRSSRPPASGSGPGPAASPSRCSTSPGCSTTPRPRTRAPSRRPSPTRRPCRRPYGEAENALVNLAAGKRAAAVLADGEARAHRASDAAQTRYAMGFDDLTAALDAEQAWRTTHSALTAERVQASAARGADLQGARRRLGLRSQAKAR